MKIVYLLFRCLARLISLLPFRVLYFVSGCLAFKLAYVFRYRRSVIDKNLLNSFPHLTAHERKRIRKQYYRHIADLVMEVIKTRGMKISSFHQRFRIVNIELMEKYLSQGKSVIIATGHLGNWEWFGVYMSTFPQYNPWAVVKPLSDKFFEQYLNSLRLKFADKGLIDFKKAFREMVKMKAEPSIYLIAGDQTPTKDEINYWMDFLNQDTAVFLGVEKIARSLGHVVLFMDLYRVKRGYYEATFKLITEKPGQTEEFEITRTHVQMLEQAIINRPYNWLWSHRRWKHSRS